MDRTVQKKPQGFDLLREDIDRLSEMEGEEFKKTLKTVLKSLVAVVEATTRELKSGQETSAKAFQAVTEALKALTQKFGN